MGSTPTNPLSIPPPPGLDQKVPTTFKEKALGVVGGALAGGAGLDFSQTELGKKLQAVHQAKVDEAAMYYRNAALYAGALSTGFDPTTGKPLTPEQRAQYENWYNVTWGQYEKSVGGAGKDVKAGLQQKKTILDMIINRGRERQAQAQNPNAGSPQSATNPVTGQTIYGPERTASMPPPPERFSAENPTRQTQAESDFAMWQRTQKYASELKIEEEQAKAKAQAQAKTGSTPRPVTGRVVTVLHARDLAKSIGKTYPDKNGKDIDLSLVPDDMSLQPYTMRVTVTDDEGNSHEEWPTRYEPIDPDQKFFTVGNNSYAVNPGNVSEVPSGRAGTYMGEHTVPKTTTHQQVAVGPGGQLTVNTLQGTSTPQSSPVLGRGRIASVPPPPAMTSRGGPGAPAAPAAPAAARPAAGAGRGAGAAAKPGATPSPQKPAGGAPATPAAAAPLAMPPGIRGIPISSYNTFLDKVRPPRVAATQIFGDPARPSFKPLSAYADVAANKNSQERIATAWNLIRKYADQAGANEHSGDLVTIMKNYLGTPGAVAASDVAKMSDALTDLARHPDEVELLNRLFSTYGSIFGLRKLTTASAAKFSAINMENEVPIPGMNVTDKHGFYDKLLAISEEINTGLKGIPEQVLEPGERDFYMKAQEDLAQKAQEARSKGKLRPPPGSTPRPKTAEEYFKLHPIQPQP